MNFMMKTFLSVAAVAALAGTAMADVGPIIAWTSFEEGMTGAQYVDTGDASVDHDLVNNPGQADVDFVSVGGEMGVDAYYRNTRGSVGATEGDFLGITTFTGTVGAFTDGVQGYQLQDADGTIGFNFDRVDFTGQWNVNLDLWVQTTGYEANDSIRVWVTVDGGTEIDILNTIGSDINDLGIEGSWMTLGLDLSAWTTAVLSIELESNSASEAIFVDNVRFIDKIPTPGALALFGIAGLSASRRRRA